MTLRIGGGATLISNRSRGRSGTPYLTRLGRRREYVCGNVRYRSTWPTLRRIRNARMSDYRRYFVPGGTYFFTLVTEHRSPLFAQESARCLLGEVMRRCFLRYPVDVLAIVLLPEHLHTLWTLSPGDCAYSLRWRWIKWEFTRAWLDMGGAEERRSGSRLREQRRGIWQRRFWEHTIRDETNLESHFDYIHYNPVKHGLVDRPADWPWSSFHRWVRAGHYAADWASNMPPMRMPRDAGE
jgi:putative transposase